MDEQKTAMETTTLFQLLFKTPSLEDFLEKNAAEIKLQPFHEYITRLCEKRGELPEHIIKRANIERSFGHQLFKGTRKPSRDTVLQLAFGFEANVATAQEFLKHARMSALHPRVKRDVAIIYCLHNHFSIIETQTILHDMQLPLLGGNKAK